MTIIIKTQDPSHHACHPVTTLSKGDIKVTAKWVLVQSCVPSPGVVPHSIKILIVSFFSALRMVSDSTLNARGNSRQPLISPTDPYAVGLNRETRRVGPCAARHHHA
jgi:hypothetical protein